MFKRSPNFPLEKTKIWMVNQLLIGLCLTLPEVKKLRAKQAFAKSPQQYNNQYAIVTFEEVLAKLKSKRIRTNHWNLSRNKTPSFHEAQNLHIMDKLLEE
jgi:glycerophosphoryl diester phosphodiesterase